MKKYIKFGEFYLYEFEVNEECCETDFIQSIQFCNKEEYTPQDFSSRTTEYIASLLEKLNKLFGTSNFCVVTINEREEN